MRGRCSPWRYSVTPVIHPAAMGWRLAARHFASPGPATSATAALHPCGRHFRKPLKLLGMAATRKLARCLPYESVTQFKALHRTATRAVTRRSLWPGTNGGPRLTPVGRGPSVSLVRVVTRTHDCERQQRSTNPQFPEWNSSPVGSTRGAHRDVRGSEERGRWRQPDEGSGGAKNITSALRPNPHPNPSLPQGLPSGRRRERGSSISAAVPAPARASCTGDRW